MVASAAVLAIVVLGLLAALDSTARSAAGNRQRSVAAALAESDQERMRGMRASELSGYDDRLRYRSPPSFLDPVSAAWRVIRSHEQVPAT